MNFEKKDFIYIGIIILLLIIIVWATAGYQSRIFTVEKQLIRTQTENKELGEQLGISLDRTRELAERNQQLTESAQSIERHNTAAYRLIESGLSETADIDEIIGRIEQAISEIEQAIQISVDNF